MWIKTCKCALFRLLLGNWKDDTLNCHLPESTLVFQSNLSQIVISMKKKSCCLLLRLTRNCAEKAVCPHAGFLEKLTGSFVPEKGLSRHNSTRTFVPPSLSYVLCRNKPTHQGWLIYCLSHSKIAFTRMHLESDGQWEGKPRVLHWQILFEMNCFLCQPMSQIKSFPPPYLAL